MTTLIPGSEVTWGSQPPPRVGPTDTSLLTVLGYTQRGPTTPKQVSTPDEFATVYGSAAFDTLLTPLTAFWTLAGSVPVQVARIEDADAATSTVTIGGLVVTAVGKGTWGNGAAGGLSAEIVAGVGGSTYQLVVKHGGVEFARSGDATTRADVLPYFAGNAKVIVTDSGSGSFTTTASANLVGGTDEHASADAGDRSTALARLTDEYGIGQLVAPGFTDSTTNQALLAHAKARNRYTLPQLADSGSAATLASARSTAVGSQDGTYGATYAPLALVGDVYVPWTIIAAAQMARNDRNASTLRAAFGESGIAETVTGLSQTPFSDADRGTLGAAGVNPVRLLNGQYRTYDNVTMAPTAAFSSITHARTRMAITARFFNIAERYVGGDPITRTRLNHLAADLELDLRENIGHDGARLSDVLIDTGPQVNTDAELALKKVRAKVWVQMPETARKVLIDATYVPTGQELPR